MNENVEIEQKQQATHKKGEKQLPNLFIFLSTNWDDRFLSTEFMSKATNRIYIIYIYVYIDSVMCANCDLRLARRIKLPHEQSRLNQNHFGKQQKRQEREEKKMYKKESILFFFLYTYQQYFVCQHQLFRLNWVNHPKWHEWWHVYIYTYV